MNDFCCNAGICSISQHDHTLIALTTCYFTVVIRAPLYSYLANEVNEVKFLMPRQGENNMWL